MVTGLGGLALLAAGVMIYGSSGGWELSAAGDLKGNVAYPLLVGLVLLTGCAEEETGTGSVEMRGVGLFAIPLPVVALVVLGIVLLVRRRR